MLTFQKSGPKLLLVTLLCLCCGLPSTADDAPALTKDQIKQFLLTAKIVGDRPAKKGITETHRLTLSEGTITHDANFQSIDEHQFAKEFSDGHKEMRFVDSYKYNIAAYILAEMVGFDDMMPVYVERKYQGKDGSLSWWLSVKMDEVERIAKKIEPPDQDAWNLQMYKVRVFDELVYDTDVNLTNVLISPDWKIWRIDFSRAFRTFHALKNPKDLVRCDRHMFELMKALNADEFTAKAKPYLTKEEIKAVMARRDLIVQSFQNKIAEQGEAQVLY
ncbi:MAG TPA: hypothetical protein VMP68_29345 [Candidatus Eisenbacteria bacterium]|nr:hypothetical protein [Candidatus Eisenbacteria bacterium]